MSMHQGLDLSRFKRVSSDKKTTVLRHAKGHEIKVAHSGLTPKMREHIESLPQHDEAEVKRYANGTPKGPVSQDDEGTDEEAPKALDPASPEPAQDTPAQTPAAEPNPTESPLAQAAQPQPAAAPTDQAAPQPTQAPAPAATPAPAQPQAPQRPNPAQITQQLNNETSAFASDLSQGHIKPETYESLYAKKDTLGKIGTLFGLLVSGAGAGLTHQPNAVLGMMDKEIERDLEAQKQSATNKETWYSAGLKHAMNQAQIEQMGVQNIGTLATAGLTQAQTGKVPYEIKETQARTQGLGIDNQIKHQTVVRNNMELGLLQNLQNNANKLPPGPVKDQYMNQLKTVSDAAAQRMQQRNAEAGQKIGAVDAMRGASGTWGDEQPQEEQAQGGIDMDRMNQLGNAVMYGEKLGVPYTTPEGTPVTSKDLAKATDESEMVERNRALYNMWDKSFKKLNTMAAGGKLNSSMRDAEVELIAGEILKQATGSGMGADEAHKKANAMFPDWKDWGGSREAKQKSMRDQFQAREASAVTAKRLGLVKPFPGETSGKTMTAQGGGRKYPEGSRKGGFVVQGGKWVPEQVSKTAKK